MTRFFLQSFAPVIHGPFVTGSLPSVPASFTIIHQSNLGCLPFVEVSIPQNLLDEFNEFNNNNKKYLVICHTFDQDPINQQTVTLYLKKEGGRIIMVAPKIVTPRTTGGKEMCLE